MITVDYEMARLDTALRSYVEQSKKGVDEVLVQKGRDLGIQLFKGFRAQRWGIRGRRNIGLRELRNRSKSGAGILVRERTLNPRWARNIPRFQNTTARGVRAGRDIRDHYPTSLWQRLVAQELLRRQTGIGVLSASFLWFRRAQRWSVSKDKYVPLRTTEFVKNKAGVTLGTVEKGDGFVRITGLTPGLSKIGERYNIVGRAIAAVTADINLYLERKANEARTRAGLL